MQSGATSTAALGTNFSSRALVLDTEPSVTRTRGITLGAIGVLVVLNGADVVTTHMLLAHRGLEANPLSSLLLASASLLWVKLGLLALLGMKVLGGKPRLGVMAVACFAAGIYATAVVSNLLVLRLVGT